MKYKEKSLKEIYIILEQNYGKDLGFNSYEYFKNFIKNEKINKNILLDLINKKGLNLFIGQVAIFKDEDNIINVFFDKFKEFNSFKDALLFIKSIVIEEIKYLKEHIKKYS